MESNLPRLLLRDPRPWPGAWPPPADGREAHSCILSYGNMTLLNFSYYRPMAHEVKRFVTEWSDFRIKVGELGDPVVTR
jgi:hypothetical protein